MTDPLCTYIDRIDLSIIALRTLLASIEKGADNQPTVTDAEQEAAERKMEVLVDHAHQNKKVREREKGPADQPRGTIPRRSKNRKEKPQTSGLDDKYRRWKKVNTHLTNLLGRVDNIGAPVKAGLNGVITSARSLDDRSIAEKAVVKFNNIFGPLLSSVETSRKLLKPTIDMMDSVEARMYKDVQTINKYKKELHQTANDEYDAGHIHELNIQIRKLKEREESLSATPHEAKEVFDNISKALKIIPKELESIKSELHQDALLREMKKQISATAEMKAKIKYLQESKGGASKDQVIARLNSFVQGAELYVHGLMIIADPEFADRIGNNVHRATKEDIPKLISALHSLALAYGAKYKKKGSALEQLVTVASRSSRKRSVQSIFSKKIHRIAKRDAILRYLSTTS